MITTGIGGQPGTLMIGLPLTMVPTGTAPVGFGAAPGMPPYVAQVPSATIAAAPSAASSSIDR